MNLDLEQSLDQLARSVGDGVAAERLGGQVHHMVARIRRRRAARRTATGVVGVGAAAAVVVGGVQHLGRDSAPTPPAEPTPDMLEVPLEACGTSLAQLGWTGVGPVGIEPVDGLPTGREDGGVSLTTEIVKHDAVELRLDATAPRYLAVDPQTGLVAGVHDVGEPSPEPDWAAAGDLLGVDGQTLQRFHVSASMPLRDCDAAPDDFGPDALLSPGTYDIHAMQVVHPTQTYRGLDAFVAVGGPWRIEVPARPDDDAAGLTVEQERAADQIDRWIASPVPNPDGVMPRCGAEAVLDDGSTPLVLDHPLDGRTIQPDRDGYFETTATMRTRGDQYVIGNAAEAGATLVLMREGVVVGYQWLDSEDVVDVDLQPGQTLEIPLRGNQLLCGTGAGGTQPALRLPPGTYQAVAVVDVMLKEVGVVGGDAESVTRTVPVMSEVIDLTLQ